MVDQKKYNRTGKLIRENAEHCCVLDRIQVIPKKLSQLKHFIGDQQFDNQQQSLIQLHD